MGFLRTLAPIEGGVFWCHREGSEIDPKIHEVVEHHHGRLVPIAGFDELMLQLQEKLQLSFLLPQLQSVHDKRVLDYQKQFETLTAALRRPAESPAAEEARKPVRKAAEAAVERLTKEKNWWAWELKASGEPDPVKREAIYRAGLEDFPESAELDGNFAIFMSDVRKDYDEAERLYRKALELNPNLANHTANFAVFMKNVRKDYDEAERLYRKALELNPNLANTTGYFANFMMNVHKDYDEAERLYRKALELDPNYATTAVNFAQFLGAMDRLDEAHELSVRAWRLMDTTPSSGHSEVALTRWLLDRVANRDGSPALGRLKTLLETGFDRETWSFDHLLATLLPRLHEDERSLAQKLADAILDESKVAALEDESLWKAVEPIPLNVPWPD